MVENFSIPVTRHAKWTPSSGTVKLQQIGTILASQFETE